MIDLVIRELVKDFKSKDPKIQARASACHFFLAPQLLNPNPIPGLVLILKDPDPAARRETAERLGSLGAEAKAAVPALMELLNDPDDTVQTTAAVALFQIQGKWPEDQG